MYQYVKHAKFLWQGGHSLPNALNFIAMNDIKIFITAERGREEWDCGKLDQSNRTQEKGRWWWWGY